MPIFNPSTDIVRYLAKKNCELISAHAATHTRREIVWFRNKIKEIIAQHSSTWLVPENAFLQHNQQVLILVSTINRKRFVLGFVYIFYHDSNVNKLDERCAEIALLCVHRDYLNKRFGSTLLLVAIGAAYDNQAKHIRLIPANGDKSVFSLIQINKYYRQFGFENRNSDDCLQFMDEDSFWLIKNKLRTSNNRMQLVVVNSILTARNFSRMQNIYHPELRDKGSYLYFVEGFDQYGALKKYFVEDVQVLLKLHEHSDSLFPVGKSIQLFGCREHQGVTYAVTEETYRIFTANRFAPRLLGWLKEAKNPKLSSRNFATRSGVKCPG